jgi:predicted ATP-grasp superfamily ATP-dependent carboligase
MYATGLGIARNLAPHGVTVYGLSVQTDAPGNFSNRCHALHCPDSQDEPDALRAFLIDLATGLGGRALLLPTRDADIRFLDQNRSALEPYYEIPQPSGDRLDVIMNKHRLAEETRAASVPTPLTMRLRTRDDAREAASRFAYPVVAKAVYAQDWRKPGIADAVNRRKAVKIGSALELTQFFERVEPHHPDLLVQEWIEGADDQCVVLGAYRGRGGRLLGWFTARKMLQYPPEFGLGCIVRLEPHAEVERLGKRLLEALAFEGIAEVEFKRHAPSGEYRLIEVNPRHWDQHALGMSCGVNLAWIAYRDRVLGDALEPVAPNGAQGAWVSGSGLLGSLKEDLRHGRVRPWKIADLVRASTRYAVWDPGDPGPFLGRRMGPRPRAKRGSAAGA